jgi:hypothetical protein
VIAARARRMRGSPIVIASRDARTADDAERLGIAGPHRGFGLADSQVSAMPVPDTLPLPAYAAPLAQRRARPNYVPPGYAPASYPRSPSVAHAASQVPGPAGTVRYNPSRPASCPSLPPVVSDVDVEGEAELRRLRQGSGSFLLMIGTAFVVAILASFGIVRGLGPSAKAAPVAAKSGAQQELALEAERQRRATRGQGAWVELDGVPPAPAVIATAASSASASASASAKPMAKPAKPMAKPAKPGHK